MSFTRHATVPTGAIETFVAERGSPTGRPVVLLHGNPDTHTVWESTCDLLDEQYRCIAPDLPGFGKTPPTGVTLAEQARYITDLLDGLKLDQVDLVVHDVGGPYGLAFATEHPERLRSITIFNTLFSRHYRWHFWARMWRRPVIGELVMKLMNRPLFIRETRRGSPRMPRAYAKHAYAQVTPASKAHVLKWYRAMNPEAMAGWDERFLANTAKTPKAVVWGDLDPFIPARNATTFGADPAHIHHHADCGHWVMLEEPLRAATAIAERLAAS